MNPMPIHICMASEIDNEDEDDDDEQEEEDYKEN